jgi:glycosylphosphatidylinositol transamidase (GPIT) subunit GPI8
MWKLSAVCSSGNKRTAGGVATGTMLVLIHKECGGPALETDTAVGEVCAIPTDRFPFPCFSCLEEITDESEVRLSEELGI